MNDPRAESGGYHVESNPEGIILWSKEKFMVLTKKDAMDLAYDLLFHARFSSDVIAVDPV